MNINLFSLVQGRLKDREPPLSRLVVDAEHQSDKQTQESPEHVVRPPVIRWRIGDEYMQHGQRGQITKVGGEFNKWILDGYAYDRPDWVRPLIGKGKIDPVPDHSYDVIPERLFPISSTLVEEATRLSNRLGHIEMLENTPLSWQGYGETVDDPEWIDKFPIDIRPEGKDSGAESAEGLLRVLWQSIPQSVQVDLMRDFWTTGERTDHPFYSFYAWGTAIAEYRQLGGDRLASSDRRDLDSLKSDIERDTHDGLRVLDVAVRDEERRLRRPVNAGADRGLSL